MVSINSPELTISSYWWIDADGKLGQEGTGDFRIWKVCGSGQVLGYLAMPADTPETDVFLAAGRAFLPEGFEP